jgi:thymidylate synthase
MNHMQFLCDGEHLDLSINYRSWDVLLGAPWNVAQYALILHLMAHTTHTTPRYLNVNAHNVHLYSNQLEAAHEQLMRDPYEYDPPRLELQTTPPVFNWGGIDKNSCKLVNYKSYGKLEKQPPMLSYT